MEHPLIGFIVFALLFLGPLALAIYVSVFRDFKSYKECTCGQFDKCKEYTEITAQGRITKHGMFSCPKNQEQIKKLVEHPFFKKVEKDIKEKGSSGPWPDL